MAVSQMSNKSVESVNVCPVKYLLHITQGGNAIVVPLCQNIKVETTGCRVSTDHITISIMGFGVFVLAATINQP